MSIETEQFWAGDFGKSYLERNQVDWTKRIPFYRRIVEMTNCESVFDLGCNAGWNLRAIHKVSPNIEMAGCDINLEALEQADEHLPMADLDHLPASQIASFYGGWGFDLVMTAGVLIHIPPEEINTVMGDISLIANDYVLAIEYDCDQEQEILYRGHDGKLWKRPYGRMYEELGLKVEFTTQVGPELGFGEGCTAWLLRKAA